MAGSTIAAVQNASPITDPVIIVKIDISNPATKIAIPGYIGTQENFSQFYRNVLLNWFVIFSFA